MKLCAKMKLSDIEDLVKRKVIEYDHKAKTTENKFGKEFKLKGLKVFKEFNNKKI